MPKPPRRPNQVMLRLSDEELAFIDASAAAADMNRSQWLRSLLKPARIRRGRPRDSVRAGPAS